MCLTSAEDFYWVSGEDQYRSYQATAGYSSTFCGTCGSHLPDPKPGNSTYWIPAGLLDAQDPGLKVAAHVFVDSKATWDKIGDNGIQHGEHFPESPQIFFENQ